MSQLGYVCPRSYPHREDELRIRILLSCHFFRQMTGCFKGKNFPAFKNVLVSWRKCKLCWISITSTFYGKDPDSINSFLFQHLLSNHNILVKLANDSVVQ